MGRYWALRGTLQRLLLICLMYVASVRAKGRPRSFQATRTANQTKFRISNPPLSPVIPNISATSTSIPDEMNVTEVYGIKTYTNQDVTYRMIVSDVTDHVCGLAPVCNKTLYDWRIRRLCTFECSKCKCDEKCHFYGDCCVRKLFEFSPNKPSNRSPFITCASANDARWGGKPNIYMVTKCPENSGGDRCISPDLTRLSEATPVSDISSEITYANKFCAACHNFHEYRAWRQRVKCPFMTSLQKAVTRQQLWALVMADKSCTKEFLPPPNLEVRECYPYTHGSCNVTGEWIKHISPLTETLCNLYNHTVAYNSYGETPVPVVYKNVFCALCNGASLEEPSGCRQGGKGISPALSVLLQFNPSEERISEESRSPLNCPPAQMRDPFSGTCQNLRCSARRILFDGECIIPYVTCSGLGFSYEQKFRLEYDSIINTTTFIDDYVAYFRKTFKSFEPIVVEDFEIRFYVRKHKASNDVEIVYVAGKFISSSTECTVEDIEWHIKQFLSMPWTFNNNNSALVSRKTVCPNDEPHGVDYKLLSTKTYHYDATKTKTGLQGSFYPTGLNCSFLEYDLSLANFSFQSENNTLFFKGEALYLNTSDVTFCNNTLKICSHIILGINDSLVTSGRSMPRTVTPYTPTLSIVSTICLGISLVCLFNTFVIFCLVTKLRTAPGKNTMALLVHLFLAQLFFLSLSNRVDIKILCQAFAILIHYFWLTTFAWMMGLAYQLHRVLTSFPSMARNDSKNKRLVWKYLLICDLTATTPVIACIAYYQITSEATDLGYGRTLCFLNDAWAIGVFFTGPVCLMLAFNGFCFTRTILTVGCRQKVDNATANPNINFLFIYIKLSILFGFSWTFGLSAAIFNSKILWYIFVLLTGSQGTFIFFSYCTNKKIWTSFKRTLSRRN